VLSPASSQKRWLKSSVVSGVSISFSIRRVALLVNGGGLLAVGVVE
jgi:hypothetical protein